MFPLYLIKRCFSELSWPWRYELRKQCFGHYIFKQPLFKVTFFKDIFLWIFNLEQKIIVPAKHGNNYFFEPSKKNSMQLRSNDSTNKSLCCRHYTKMLRTLHFWEHIFYHSLSSQCCSLWLCKFFCSYLSKMRLWNYYLLYLIRSIIMLYNLLLT